MGTPQHHCYDMKHFTRRFDVFLSNTGHLLIPCYTFLFIICARIALHVLQFKNIPNLSDTGTQYQPLKRAVLTPTGFKQTLWLSYLNKLKAAGGWGQSSQMTIFWIPSDIVYKQ